ncbi:glycosyltransferase [Bacillus cereus]|uniref:glycosyltransferase n=1 Tax=Bacillus cereus TaxID=1396 RepID=UPI0007AC0533|nr:glycosyltransferase [Bacillus cereus]KZD27992.1 glycosyl transferase group 1 [Bacillus cereus]MCC2396111.1 glycosyltransferase [Bacillus cereus]MCU5657791.1 glycosyltransferase [Bacillus cereus]
MYDFLMIGWELDYSRNRVMVDKSKLKIKEVQIGQGNILLRYIKIFFQILFALIRYKTNTVYIPAFNQANAPIIILISKIFRKKIVVDILVSEYDTIVEDRKLVPKGSLKAKKAYLLDQICLKYADVLICDTELHKKYFINKFGCSAEKISVIPVGAEEHFTYIPKKGSNEIFTVVFYGGFSPLHGVDIILNAAAELKDDPNISFTLVGNGQTKQQMVKLADKLKLENITFIDRIDYEKLPLFLSEFDIGLGIFGETDKVKRVVPNKVYQVAACRLPVITLDTPGIKEVFTNNANIILISPEGLAAKNLADAIQNLKLDNRLKAEIAMNGYNLMKEHYSVSKIRSMFNSLI